MCFSELVFVPTWLIKHLLQYFTIKIHIRIGQDYNCTIFTIENIIYSRSFWLAHIFLIATEITRNPLRNYKEDSRPFPQRNGKLCVVIYTIKISGSKSHTSAPQEPIKVWTCPLVVDFMNSCPFYHRISLRNLLIRQIVAQSLVCSYFASSPCINDKTVNFKYW